MQHRPQYSSLNMSITSRGTSDLANVMALLPSYLKSLAICSLKSPLAPTCLQPCPDQPSW